MLDKYLQIETLSIVFLGDFNPVIFQPFWMANKQLIREDEAKNAKIEIIHNEIVKYELVDWLNFEVTRNRCVFKTTKEPYFEPLKDLIIGIFKILKETPIKSLGINNIYDLSLQSEADFYKFGSRLTPLDFWNDDLRDPRLLLLEIFEKERKDGQKGSRRVRIAASEPAISFGVNININNHFDTNSSGADSNLISLIETNWKKSFNESEDIVENLLSKINL